MPKASLLYPSGIGNVAFLALEQAFFSKMNGVNGVRLYVLMRYVSVLTCEI